MHTLEFVLKNNLVRLSGANFHDVYINGFSKLSDKVSSSTPFYAASSFDNKLRCWLPSVGDVINKSHVLLRMEMFLHVRMQPRAF